MPLMQLHKNYVLQTLKGHRIAFEKDKPVSVPPVCVSDAAAIGAKMVDGTATEIEIEPPKGPVAPTDPTKRQDEILEGIKMICEGNARTDFEASGAPRTAAIGALLKYEIDRKERDLAWQRYHDEKAALE